MRSAANGPERRAGPLVDARGRPLHDLRISVTDRCNFRCVYCMPRDVFDADYKFLPHAELLTFEEIARDRAALRRPRRGEDPAHRRRAAVAPEPRAAGRDAGARRASPTSRSRPTARCSRRRRAALRDAGLTRVTVSLDSLDDATFRAMNDADFPVAKVLEGIDAAAAAGLAPVKINMVVKRGVNDGGIVAMARHFRGHRAHRPLHRVHGCRRDQRLADGRRRPGRRDRPRDRRRVSARKTRSGLCRRGGRSAGGTSDGSGEIGVIASVTQAFCRDCSRARLSTDGRLYTCLFANDGFDLRALVRGGLDDAAIDARDRRDLAPADGQLFGDPHRRNRAPAESRNVVHRRLAVRVERPPSPRSHARPRPASNSWRACAATTTAHGSSGTSRPTISCGRNSRSWSPILRFASPDSIPSSVRWTRKRRCSGFTVTCDSPRTRRHTRRTSAPRSATARSAGKRRAITSASTMQERCSSAAASIVPIHRSCCSIRRHIAAKPEALSLGAA